MANLPKITTNNISSIKRRILGLSGNKANTKLRKVYVNSITRNLLSFNYNNKVKALYNLLGAQGPSIQQTSLPYNNLLKASKQPIKPLREVKIDLIKKFLNARNTTKTIESLMQFAKLTENKKNLTNDSKRKILLIMSIYNAKNIKTLNNLRVTNKNILSILENRRHELKNIKLTN